MRAIWYERQGAASHVLTYGELLEPEPARGEVRIRVRASGINPGDLKKRQDAFGIGMPYPPRHPAQRRRRHRRSRGGRSTGVARRPTGVVLRGPDLPTVRDGSRVRRRPVGAGRVPPGWSVVRAGSMPWHPGHHGPPSRACRRSGLWTNRARSRRRQCSGLLCRRLGSVGRRACNRNRPVRDGLRSGNRRGRAWSSPNRRSLGGGSRGRTPQPGS